jgi:microsomal dipeptidase-like Zn-dependent dipeptidase
MIKNINIILVLLLALGCRAVYAADISQAIIFISLSAVYSYSEYLKQKNERTLSDSVAKQLEEMKGVVGSLAIKNSVKPGQVKEEINARWF